MIILSWSVWVCIVIFLPAVLSSYFSYVFFFLVLPLWQFRTPNLNWTITRQEKQIAGERDSKRWLRSGSFDEPQKKRWQRNVPDAVPNVLWYNVLLFCNVFFCWECAVILQSTWRHNASCSAMFGPNSPNSPGEGKDTKRVLISYRHSIQS